MSDPLVSERGPVGTAAPTLSVLIPCWNAATTIERAMASVLEEREVALECVVIDDGSTDGTSDIVEAFARQDGRVVLVRLETNAGVSNARNQGLAVSRGEWVTFLDGDDRLLPGAIAALMRPTADPEVLAVIGQRIWTDGERRWVTPLYDIPDVRTPGRKSIATHPGLLYYASATGRILQRSIIGDRRFHGRVLGDQPWAIHAMLRAGDHIEVIGETVYEWQRPHPDRYVPTLTAETRSSASRAVEMATVARTAYLEVCGDVDALVAEEAAQQLVKRTYFERLVRADIADRLRVAADRRDPATGAFYDAVGQFFEAVPVAILASTDVHLRQVVRSAAYRFSVLAPGARASYWRMIRPILSKDPRSSLQVGGNPSLAAAFWLARTLRPSLGESMAGAILFAVSSVALLMRRIGLA